MKQIWWNAFLSDSDAKLGSISLANKKIIEILFHLLRQQPLFATKARQPDTLCRISHTGTGTPWGQRLELYLIFASIYQNFFCLFVFSLYLCNCICPLRLWSTLSCAEPMGGALHIERRYWRFVFGRIETTTIELLIKNNAGVAPRGVSYTAP